MSRDLLQRHRLALAVVLAATLLMRALVPAGWMPAIADGQLITICSGMGEAKLWIDANGNPVETPHDKNPSGDRACAFAASLGGFMAPLALCLACPLGIAAVDLPGRLAVAVGLGLAAPPPPAIGPPALR
jgi:hypothetical protein